MERTARLIVDALFAERNVVANHLDDVGGGVDSIYCGAVNHRNTKVVIFSERRAILRVKSFGTSSIEPLSSCMLPK